MVDSHIAGGSFTNGSVYLPKEAIVDSSQAQIVGKYTTLTVQSDLDLYSMGLTFTQDFVLGEWSQTSPGYAAYIAYDPTQAYMYFSSQYKNPYFPLTGTGDFQNPSFYGAIDNPAGNAGNPRA